ncbi:ThuA domain-containing protein [Pelagicoccus mobilis]|uniref:ThuA domain-containing protein n=1 Tax=Pelagicoccus mobilis TaxID=415221 RepID=A0A934RVQ9_9BACT|nr:ThuA domain-containing protein [Pelagicoccus mobilis]MBK1875307.1 ThuA domain-containing protein [Pelagicoccus mobilis]
MKILTVFSFLILLTSSQAQTINVLLISGQNNHNWRLTTPLIHTFLESSEKISVKVTESPQTLNAADLSEIDVIVSNWNTFASKSVKKPVSEWSEEAKIAYVDFVRNGGGHVVVHAGSTSFHDWDDYFAISLMRWGLSGTTHGKRHSFPVRLDEPSHPVLKNFNPQTHFDELWRNVEVHPDATIVASSFSGEPGGTQEWEPSVFVGQFGKGRCFATTLGHDASILASPQLQTLITQAVIWTKGE